MVHSFVTTIKDQVPDHLSVFERWRGNKRLQGLQTLLRYCLACWEAYDIGAAFLWMACPVLWIFPGARCQIGPTQQVDHPWELVASRRASSSSSAQLATYGLWGTKCIHMYTSKSNPSEKCHSKPFSHHSKSFASPHRQLAPCNILDVCWLDTRFSVWHQL